MTIDSDKDVTAAYTEWFRVVVEDNSVYPAQTPKWSWGSYQLSPAGDANGYYEDGTEVTLTMIPELGYQAAFSCATGTNAQSSENSYRMIIEESRIDLTGATVAGPDNRVFITFSESSQTEYGYRNEILKSVSAPVGNTGMVTVSTLKQYSDNYKKTVLLFERVAWFNTEMDEMGDGAIDNEATPPKAVGRLGDKKIDTIIEVDGYNVEVAEVLQVSTTEFVIVGTVETATEGKNVWIKYVTQDGADHATYANAFEIDKTDVDGNSLDNVALGAALTYTGNTLNGIAIVGYVEPMDGSLDKDMYFAKVNNTLTTVSNNYTLRDTTNEDVLTHIVATADAYVIGGYKENTTTAQRDYGLKASVTDAGLEAFPILAV
jgi:hypothetical protein